MSPQYKKVFMYLFNMAMMNSFLMFKDVNGYIGQLLIFRQVVVESLVSEYLPQAP